MVSANRLRIVLGTCALVFLTTAASIRAAEAEPAERWSTSRAWAWYRNQSWLVGFNYVPSTACNTTEWWQAETFDVETIERELGWANDLGFNTIRCFIQYLVWKQDAEGFKSRFERFLSIADKHKITVMPVLFDDCAFGDPRQLDPYVGRQREPVPGMILPSWTPSPGRRLGLDPAERGLLEAYVRDLVSAFGDDKRVVLWDLYNEPMNVAQVGTPELLRRIYHWARLESPTQPLTISSWNSDAAVNEVVLAESDVISFHHYGPYEAVRSRIAYMKQQGRPVVCTEWMARPAGSRIETELPLFKREAVGCYMWGFVNGRTQCQFPWWNKPNDPVREPGWFHDILHTDGTHYREAEIKAIRDIVAQKVIDFTKTDYTLPQFAPHELNDTDRSIRYSEGWTLWRGPQPLGGTLHYANAEECVAELTFTGSNILLIHKVGPDCGIAEITIDNEPAPLAGQIDTFGETVQWNASTPLAKGLAPGRHHVTIRVTGRKRNESSNTYIQIVGFELPGSGS